MDRRTPMIAGIAFAVLFTAALLIVPTLPGIDRPGYDIVSHVHAHSGAMRMQVLLVTFGLLALVEVLGSATARTLADVVAMWGPILTVADIMVAEPILLAANEGRFPRWLGIVAAVFAVEQLIETITIIGPPASFISPGGAMNFYLGGRRFINKII